MQKNPKVKALAGRLVQLTLDENQQVCGAKVEEVLATLRKNPPRFYKSLLKEFLFGVKKAIAAGQAIVEYAGEPSDASIASIEQQLSQQYGRPIKAVKKENLALLAGVKITIADDVYDASVAGRLQTLSSKVH